MGYFELSATEESDRSEVSSATETSSLKRTYDKKIHACDFKGCDKKFSRPWKLKAHKALHSGKRSFPCDICEKSYTNVYHLRRHKKTSHSKEIPTDNTIKCRDATCGKLFKTAQNEKKHFTRTHIDKTCQECGKIFFKKSQLKKHAFTHLGTKPYICNTCDEGFDHLYLLNRHKRGHVLHLCSVKTCKEVFPNWSSLRKHLSTHPYDFICSYCNRGYFKKKCLITHIKRHMGGTIGRRQTPLQIYQCDICSKSIKGKASLRRHKKVIHENVKKTKTIKKPRAPRKDKGIPRKSIASLLSTIEIPRDVEKNLVNGIAVNDNKLFSSIQ